VFARSFFADPEEFSAGELIAMFHQYFVGSAEGLLFDVPDDDYDTALWGPLTRYLIEQGVDVRAGEAVTGIDSTATGVAISSETGNLSADAVVLATDLAAAQRLVPPDDDDGWRAGLARLRPAPPFAVWRLWLDRAAHPDRPPFLGTSGFGPTDNISLVDRYEAGAAAWAHRHGGAVAELHAYALPSWPAHDDALKAHLRGTLDTVYPELAGARTLGEQWLVRDDCPLLGVNTWADRPAVRTGDPRIVLAGDGIRSAHPVALMERAATTGFEAANELLARWGLVGHELWTVPTRGLLARRPKPAGQARERSSYSRSA
jgi:isorenieratene synthase